MWHTWAALCYCLSNTSLCAAIPYEVTVWTSDLKSAGTNSNVFLQIYGEKGKTEEVQLHNKTDNFERAAVDKFKVWPLQHNMVIIKSRGWIKYRQHCSAKVGRSRFAFLNNLQPSLSEFMLLVFQVLSIHLHLSQYWPCCPLHLMNVNKV